MEAYRIALESLNDAQRRAVMSDSDRLLIIAGPGSGKTRVLTVRIARFINELSKSGDQVLALTFTRKAANRMKTQLSGLCPEREVRKMRIGTFHGVCLRIIYQWAETLGLDRQYLTVYDDVDQVDIIERIVKKMGTPERDRAKTIKSVLEMIKDPSAGHVLDMNAIEPTIVAEYYATLNRQHALDYNMLIGRAIGLLQINKAALRHYRNNWSYLCVDEYQDTDPEQQKLLDLLLGDGGMVTCVGDDDQSVYRWRRADPKIMLGFPKRYPRRYEAVQLDINYRSTREIVDAASCLIAQNFDRFKKSITAHSEEPGMISVEMQKINEAVYVGDLIKDSANNFQDGDTFKDIAVLARTNAQLLEIAAVLRHYEIPYQLCTPYDVWKSIPVKRFMDAMRLSENPHDDLACRHLLQWPAEIADDFGIQGMIVEQTTQALPLIDIAANQGIGVLNHTLLSDLLSVIMGARDRKGDFFAALDFLQETWRPLLSDPDIQNLGQWRETIAEFEGSVGQFLRWCATRRIEDDIKIDEDSVKLMTAHSAKGLEFRYVIIAGCHEGRFPMRRKDTNLEEERCLFYVALTRAEKQLWLTWQVEPSNMFQKKDNVRSRFISEMGL